MERSPVSDTHILNGRYKLLERVGSGGMAAVYKSEDLALGRTVAVKVLHPSLTGDEAFLTRFQKEAHAAANLTHPNIVTVHDIGQDGDRYYIVMEFVDGLTLKQLIRERQSLGAPLPLSRALDLMIQTCTGMGYAHRSGLVHCDVKPHNMLVTEDGRVKVADFGIARAMTEATLTHQNQVWGTPRYFSPEQAAGRTPTPASDVYSLGVILFELLTNQLPFDAETQAAVALKHLQEPPPPVRSVNDSVPPQLDRIVSKVLSKEPAQRYRTAGQFGRILQSYRAGNLDTTPVGPGAVVAMPPDEAETLVVAPSAVAPLGDPTPSTARQPIAAPAAAVSAEPVPVASPPTDWVAVLLSVIAFIALIGLIPLWYAVYLAWQ